MPKVVVPVKEEILRAAERRKATGAGKEVVQFLAELIDLGFEHRLLQLYRQFEAGELSLGYFADELGLSVRDLYAALEQRGLPTSNIGARPLEQKNLHLCRSIGRRLTQTNADQTEKIRENLR